MRTFWINGMLAVLIAAVALVVLPPVSYCEEKPSPYGTGSEYGGKKPVGTAEEAAAALEEYFAGKGLKVGEAREKEFYFEAEIRDRDGKLVDKVIIDKRTGRIRSIY
jgi:hypothetical protein